MRRLWLILGLTTALAAAGFVAILVTRTPRQEARLWEEVGKGLIQVLVIGVLGTILKLLADDQAARGTSREQVAAARAAIHRRVVAATNAVRKAPILIEANRSVKTRSEQMLAVIDAGFELSLVQHELSSTRQLPEPPFSDDERKYLDKRLAVMRAFIDGVAADFADNKKELSEQQRIAERPGLLPEERAPLQAGVWDALCGLWSVADLRGEEVDPDDRPKDTPSWEDYREAYRELLDRLTLASLAKPVA